MDRFERLTGNADTALERCRACPSRLMQPVQWRRLGDDLWEIDLRCPDCGGTARECVPQEAVARYDQVMRRARVSLQLPKQRHAVQSLARALRFAHPARPRANPRVFVRVVASTDALRPRRPVRGVHGGSK